MSWYDRNKEKVKQAKRSEYSQYKDKISNKNKSYRDRVKNKSVIRTKVVDGEILYALSTVAGELGVDPRTIKALEDKQIFPSATLVERTRWYSLQNFIKIKEIYEKVKEE